MTRPTRSLIACAAVGALTATLLAGCTSGGSSRPRSAAASLPAQPAPGPAAPLHATPPPFTHPIDWAHPLPGGKAVNPSALDGPASAGLAFKPFVPRFSTPASTAFVWAYGRPVDRSVAIVYRLANDPRLADPEVVLRESPDRRSQADLAAELQRPPGDPKDFSLRTFDGSTVLMIINGPRSRAQFLHGGVLFDITGPEVPADVSTDLAAQVLRQLS